eukprot:scaffold1143_cov107-Isochrysis_galbana.AAC.1
MLAPVLDGMLGRKRPSLRRARADIRMVPSRVDAGGLLRLAPAQAGDDAPPVQLQSPERDQ